MTSLRIFWLFFHISLVAFGGLFGLLPELQRIIVEENHWMTGEQFVQSYAVGQLVPGPNMAMTSLIGYRVDGIPGAIAGYFGIYSTPVFFMAAASALFLRYGNVTWVRRTEIALRPLVFGLISAAALGLFWQQAREHLGAGIVLAALGIAAYRTNRASPLTVAFASGFAWWAYVRGVPQLLMWMHRGL